MRGYYENKLKEKNEELRSMNNELATLVQDYQALDAIKANSGKTDDGGGGGVFTPKPRRLDGYDRAAYQDQRRSRYIL